MSAAIASLEEFIAKRQAVEEPRPRPVLGLCVYPDASYRLLEQCRDARDVAAAFTALSAVCDELRRRLLGQAL